jgi:hypothetical protein
MDFEVLPDSAPLSPGLKQGNQSCGFMSWIRGVEPSGTQGVVTRPRATQPAHDECAVPTHPATPSQHIR